VQKVLRTRLTEKVKGSFIPFQSFGIVTLKLHNLMKSSNQSPIWQTAQVALPFLTLSVSLSLSEFINKQKLPDNDSSGDAQQERWRWLLAVRAIWFHAACLAKADYQASHCPTRHICICIAPVYFIAIKVS
jgi:hypothetical protein